MNRRLALVAVVVKDYDEAIAFYTQKLGFTLIEDTRLSAEKRWVVVSPGAGGGSNVLLARAANERQAQSIGNQAGGRVFLFLNTDDFQRDYDAYRQRGVRFVRQPVKESYGTVAVFEDLCGNLWDLIEPAK